MGNKKKNCKKAQDKPGSYKNLSQNKTVATALYLPSFDVGFPSFDIRIFISTM